VAGETGCGRAVNSETEMKSTFGFLTGLLREQYLLACSLPIGFKASEIVYSQCVECDKNQKRFTHEVKNLEENLEKFTYLS
jgi:hypothetical protein